jgi:hypothetical protein
MTVTTKKIVIAVALLGVLIAALLAYWGYKHNYRENRQVVIPPCGNHNALPAPGAALPQSAPPPPVTITAARLPPC